MSDLTLEVNGIKYQGFTDALVNRSVENLASQFSFSTTIKDSFDFMSGVFGKIQNDLKAQDFVKILIDDNSVMSGFIEDLDISYSSSSHSISVSGRDKTGDLIDSSIIPKQYFQRNFVRLLENVLSDNGHSIAVINDVADLSTLGAKEVITAEKGDTIAAFMDRYAKKLQVLLVTNADGDLVITREGSDLAVGRLVQEINGNNNNILSASINISTTERYRFFEIYSSKGNDDFIAQTVGQSGIAIDSSIRATRRKRVNMSADTESVSLKNLAKWYLNIRRAKGSRYNCRVQGFYTNRNSGLLWQPNTLVQVKDELCQVSGQFLIQGVSFVKNLQGCFTDLSIVEQGAFSIEGANIADGSSFATDLIAKP